MAWPRAMLVDRDTPVRVRTSGGPACLDPLASLSATPSSITTLKARSRIVHRPLARHGDGGRDLRSARAHALEAYSARRPLEHRAGLAAVRGLRAPRAEERDASGLDTHPRRVGIRLLADQAGGAHRRRVEDVPPAGTADAGDAPARRGGRGQALAGRPGRAAPAAGSAGFRAAGWRPARAHIPAAVYAISAETDAHVLAHPVHAPVHGAPDAVLAVGIRRARVAGHRARRRAPDRRGGGRRRAEARGRAELVRFAAGRPGAARRVRALPINRDEAPADRGRRRAGVGWNRSALRDADVVLAGPEPSTLPSFGTERARQFRRQHVQAVAGGVAGDDAAIRTPVTIGVDGLRARRTQDVRAAAEPVAGLLDLGLLAEAVVDVRVAVAAAHGVENAEAGRRHREAVACGIPNTALAGPLFAELVRRTPEAGARAAKRRAARARCRHIHAMRRRRAGVRIGLPVAPAHRVRNGGTGARRRLTDARPRALPRGPRTERAAGRAVGAVGVARAGVCPGAAWASHELTRGRAARAPVTLLVPFENPVAALGLAAGDEAPLVMPGPDHADKRRAAGANHAAQPHGARHLAARLPARPHERAVTRARDGGRRGCAAAAHGHLPPNEDHGTRFGSPIPGDERRLGHKPAAGAQRGPGMLRVSQDVECQQRQRSDNHGSKHARLRGGRESRPEYVEWSSDLAPSPPGALYGEPAVEVIASRAALPTTASASTPSGPPIQCRSGRGDDAQMPPRAMATRTSSAIGRSTPPRRRRRPAGSVTSWHRPCFEHPSRVSAEGGRAQTTPWKRGARRQASP